MSIDLSVILERVKDLPAENVLSYAARHFQGKLAFATSLGLEDQVITHMIHSQGLPIPIFTLDTGRLPEETYQTLAATEERFGLRIEVLFPDAADVERMVAEHGINLFRDSVQSRKLCCRVRKVLPLRRRLAGLGAWITGLRRQQAVTRDDLAAVQWDAANGLLKISPLADWTTEQVWQYVREHHVPYNKLHDDGYPSLGCAPCTRAVAGGENLRAGRWWWEQPEHKECGLHWNDGRLQRAK